MKAALSLAAVCAAFALCACTGNGGGLDDARFNSPDFGASVRSNIAAESVPADPASVNSPVEADGARQSLAQARYHSDKVKEPPAPATDTRSGNTAGAAAAAGMPTGSAP